MLKIKDNVDLEELKKFGFEQADFNKDYLIKYVYIDKEINYETLYINKNTREITAFDDYADEIIPIQKEWIEKIKDFVEKVGD